jgi:hypothetical protein
VDLFRVCVDRQFGLERNGTLTHLNLRSCSLGTNGCRAVLVATRSARALTFLNVAMNGIGYAYLCAENVQGLPLSSQHAEALQYLQLVRKRHAQNETATPQ